MKNILVTGFACLTIMSSALAGEEFHCSVGIQDPYGDEAPFSKFMRQDDLIVKADGQLRKFPLNGQLRGTAMVVTSIKDRIRVEAAVYRDLSKVNSPGDLSTVIEGDTNREARIFTAVGADQKSVSLSTSVAQDAVYVLYCTR